MTKIISLKYLEDYFYLDYFWKHILETKAPKKDLRIKLEEQVNSSSIFVTKYFLVLAVLGRELSKSFLELKDKNKLNIDYLSLSCKFEDHPLFKDLNRKTNPILQGKELLVWGTILEDYLITINKQFENIYLQKPARGPFKLPSSF